MVGASTNCNVDGNKNNAEQLTSVTTLVCVRVCGPTADNQCMQITAIPTGHSLIAFGSGHSVIDLE